MILKKLIDSLNKTNEIYIQKSGACSQIKLSSFFIKRGTNVIFLIKEEIEDYKNLVKLFNLSHTIFFPDFLHEQSQNLWPNIFSSFYSLLFSQQPKLIFIPLSFLFLRVPEKKFFLDNIIHLNVGEDIDLEYILETLTVFNYKKVVQVTEPGEFALRGDVLDIFCPIMNSPFRIELFGDTIDQIRVFEPVSQKSIKQVNSIKITPYFLSSTETDSLNYLKSIGEIEDVKEYNFFGLYQKNLISILDYLQKKILFIPHAEEFVFSSKEYEKSISLFCKENKLPFIYLFFQQQELKKMLSKEKKVFFYYIPQKSTSTESITLEEDELFSSDDLFWKPEDKIRPFKTLKKYLPDWLKEYKQVILSFKSAQIRDKVIKALGDNLFNVKYNFEFHIPGLYALISPLTKGYILKWDNSLILSTDLLFPTVKYKRKDFQGLKSYEELSEGDLVVHRDYGIAIFSGLKTLQFSNIKGEYLLLVYANEDKLYLPVEKINLIQKYKGPEGIVPPLDKLGGTRWSNVKERVRKEIAKIAKDLVEIYAYRKIAKRHSYSPLDEEYYEFEASFGFEETLDQSKAIAEVMADMEKEEPMDRLICGDVGFGKTEVAMRAAFRAVKDGHQVCVLCPTTILAEQHFRNFQKRMSPFGVKVGMLSRFVSFSVQKKIISEVKKGQIDILIGTHRVLSKDVEIPNLSLLILDEEQKFGVKHKEKLKKIKKEVDVLTLTATPIPRTLQLSLSGIRSLSIIETPPPARKPVKTELLERDLEKLKSILEFELNRHGQIFWVYNRVQGLNAVAERVKHIAPGAKVAIAHGQMREKELEEVMYQFYKGHIDILVCTSIIESGLDFPNVNTLIIDNAHLFGLGQLYQLRGRVGRSDKQAFAYFLVPSLKKLAPKAKKRLKVILSFDYLGAGFRLAMEDLRLRGAGNILGEAQSGQIGKIGLDLFLEMLHEEVKILQGQRVYSPKEPEIDLKLEAYIPAEYITDKKERLHYYRLLANSNCNDSRENVILAEIKDRYGSFPKQLVNFINLMQLKSQARLLGISKIYIKNNSCFLKWEQDSFNLDLNKLIIWIKNNKAQLLPTGEIKLNLKTNDILSTIKNILKDIQKIVLNDNGKMSIH
ncbi:MAG: transcription-repair coupling factor [Desulfonauticus sp.]|nr:transcription-repair coupling factor [Desulfonauticus sp.]